MSGELSKIRERIAELRKNVDTRNLTRQGILDGLAAIAADLERADRLVINRDDAEFAGHMFKILHLAAGMPGMDEVAIKLNCGLTYEEKERARAWATAIELATNAEKGTSLFKLAALLNGRLK